MRSTSADLTAQAVPNSACAAGALKVILFDSGRFPAEARITVAYRDGLPPYVVRVGGRVLHLDDVTSRLVPPSHSVVAHPTTRR